MGHQVEVVSPGPVQDLPTAHLSRDQARHGRPASRCRKWFKSFEPEAIHIATEGPIGLAARRVCVDWKLPFTTSYHTKFPEYVSARLALLLSAGYAYMRWFHWPSGPR